MAFDNTNLLENATQANNGDFVFTNRGGTVDSGVQTANSAGEWSEENGGTVSTGTGPSANPAGRSGFIYTETSSPAASTVWAMRRSASFDSTTQNVFLDLIYNLNADTGSSVFIEYATIASPNETTDWTTLETIACTATDAWISDTFDFSAISTSTLWLRVRLETTNAFTNDVAFSTWREYSVDTGGGGGGAGLASGTVHVGEWRGGTTTELAPASFGPAAVLDTEIKNDNSAYSFNFTTSTLTLPSTGLADGYLMVAALEFEDTSNGRLNLAGRILQTSGTGNSVAPIATGYCRDTSENRVYVRIWAFIDSPSAAAQFQFQWFRDVDVATGGTLRAGFEVMSLFYDSASMYSSTSNALYGGVTPNQIQNLTTVLEGAGTTRSGNSVSLDAQDKRYLVLGAGYMFGSGNSRTQRWYGVRENGTKLDYIKGYSYMRNNNNDIGGAMFSGIIQRDTAAKTLDLFAYTGDGVANNEGGADGDGSAPTSAEYYLAIIELNNNTSCLQTTNGTTTTDINQPVITDIPGFNSTLVSNGSYFTNIGANSGVTIEAAQDFTLAAGSNMSCAASNVAQTARFTGHTQFYIDNVLQNETFHGNYLRNNQGSQDTFGWSANQLSVSSITTGQTFKNTARRLAGSEGGGAPTIQSGWHGQWALALESMITVTPVARRIFSIM